MISITANPTSWTNANVTLTAKAQDTGSGITGYAWTDTATTPTSWTSITKTTAQITKETTVSANGTKYFWVKDEAGNTNNTSYTVSKIDKTAPSTFTLTKSSTGNNSFTLSANFNDASSGLSKITWYYKKPGETTWLSTTSSYTTMNGSTAGTTGSVTKTKEITGLSKGGTVSAYAVAYDVAGNAKTSYSSSSPLTFTTSTYTVSYNANGGSGAPTSQNKYYGVNLTLSSTKPTKTGYTFKGWSTSSTATSATWSAGGTYTNNASNTLYAVWEEQDWHKWLRLGGVSNDSKYTSLNSFVSNSTLEEKKKIGGNSAEARTFLLSNSSLISSLKATTDYGTGSTSGLNGTSMAFCLLSVDRTKNLENYNAGLPFFIANTQNTNGYFNGWVSGNGCNGTTAYFRQGDSGTIGYLIIPNAINSSWAAGVRTGNPINTTGFSKLVAHSQSNYSWTSGVSGTDCSLGLLSRTDMGSGNEAGSIRLSKGLHSLECEIKKQGNYYFSYNIFSYGPAVSGWLWQAWMY